MAGWPRMVGRAQKMVILLTWGGPDTRWWSQEEPHLHLHLHETLKSASVSFTFFPTLSHFSTRPPPPLHSVPYTLLYMTTAFVPLSFHHTITETNYDREEAVEENE